MTDRIALYIGVLIALCLALDWYLWDWANTLFLARKFAALIEWTAFWR
ncbi:MULTISPECIES: hypothetical protein [Sediminimonas]|nr:MULTISPECIES: hypothetical protein [Sediminimonas]MDR9485010.1 hypothetical protein [Sediminimonas sp.]